ncbi:MAG: QueT transporter family protein [Thermoproteota archaeon]
MRLRSRDVATSMVLASSYATIVLVLGPVSFGIINVRVADALRCFIPMFGWPAILGIFIGHVIANMFSPLGLIDMLSPFIVLPASILLYKVRDRSVLAGFVSIWATLSLWVSYMISIISEIGYFAVFSYVAPGILVSDIVLPYLLLKAILKVMPSWGWGRR